MLKLRINTTEGPIESDTNIDPKDQGLIKFVEFKPRQHGVGSAFKGRAPNRVLVDMGERRWRNVVVPDTLLGASITGFSIYDSTATVDPLEFVQSEENTARWDAQQTNWKKNQTRGEGRHLALIERVKDQFDWTGGIGANDLGVSITLTVEVPGQHNTLENRQALAQYAELETANMEVPVDVVIKPVGTPAAVSKPLMEGKLGAPQHPSIPIAGQHPITPQTSENPSPTRDAVVRPFESQGGSDDEPIVPGQAFEPYGSEGPQDK